MGHTCFLLPFLPNAVAKIQRLDAYLLFVQPKSNITYEPWILTSRLKGINVVIFLSGEVDSMKYMPPYNKIS